MNMQSVMKQIRSVVTNPMKRLAESMSYLQLLREDLVSYEGSMDPPLVKLVYFFNNVSFCHDRGLGDIIAAFEKVNVGQYDDVIEDLQILERYFKSAGRDINGRNRTRCGETVTERDVFLGGDCGLSVRSVHYWRKRFANHPKETTSSGRTEREVISAQAQNFMNSHIRPMCEVIDKLEAVVQEVAA